MKFRLYWFNNRTGTGQPCKANTEALTFEEANKAIHDRRGRVRHPQQFHLELHMEPEELFEKYTSKNEPI
jgi:hypothetical protein